MSNIFNPDLWPTTFDYSEALALFKSTAPIRGWQRRVTPLRRDRRYPDDHYIVWYEGMTDDAVSSVAYRVDQCDTVRWFADGRIRIDASPNRNYRRITDTLVAGLEIEYQRIKYRRNVLIVNGQPIYQGGADSSISWVTLYRDAQGKLVVSDLYKGIPVYVGREYAPAYKEIAQKLKVWRKQHEKLIAAGKVRRRQHRTPYNWKRYLWADIETYAEGYEDSMKYTPPSPSETAPFRLYTDGLPINGRKVYMVETFKDVLNGIANGTIRQA